MSKALYKHSSYVMRGDTVVWWVTTQEMNDGWFSIHVRPPVGEPFTLNADTLENAQHKHRIHCQLFERTAPK
jgi:hypothetical protein